LLRLRWRPTQPWLVCSRRPQADTSWPLLPTSCQPAANTHRVCISMCREGRVRLTLLRWLRTFSNAHTAMSKWSSSPQHLQRKGSRSVASICSHSAHAPIEQAQRLTQKLTIACSSTGLLGRCKGKCPLSEPRRMHPCRNMQRCDPSSAHSCRRWFWCRTEPRSKSCTCRLSRSTRQQ
jgi:hypothetical protein